MAFAITGGTFNTPSIWDTGVVPTGSENAYANGFTIQVSGTVSCNSVRNDASNYYLVNTAIPLMTSNTTPSGTVIVSGQGVGTEGWRAFDRSNSTLWQSNTVNVGWLGYIFPTGKIIKRYSIFTAGSGVHPRTWTFEGSNDGSSWTVLDTQTLVTLSNGTFYTYPITNTTSYTYYRINITATINPVANPALVEFEMTESTSSVIGKVVGGTFNLLNGTNLTVTANTGVVVNSATAPVTFALNSPNSATINGNIISPAISTNQTAISHTGTGTLNMNGNHSNNSTGGRVIQVTSGGILNIVGTPNNASSALSPTYDLSAGATVNMTGNITTSGTYIFYYRGACNLTITGNVSAVGAIPILTNSGNLTIIGNVSASVAFACITNTGGATVMDITGTVTAGTGANAIVGLGLVKLSGIAINTNRYNAIYAPQVTIELTTTSWNYQTFAGPDLTLYASGANVGNPAPSDVRFGVSYGLGSFTGTAYIPTPSTVLLGTQVDATTGTLLMTPAQFVSELNTSTTPVAVRLQNCATVSSTGDQVASYGV